MIHPKCLRPDCARKINAEKESKHPRQEREECDCDHVFENGFHIQKYMSKHF